MPCPLNERFLLGREMEGGYSKECVLKGTESVHISAACLTGSLPGKSGWVWIVVAQGLDLTLQGMGSHDKVQNQEWRIGHRAP